MRTKAGLFWTEVNKMTTLNGQPRFNLLHQLMAGLLSIPVSNADSEHGFSTVLRKIHTDHRANLDQSTVIALMGMKFNCGDGCCDIKFSPELLSAYKKATILFVAPATAAGSKHCTFLCLHSIRLIESTTINGRGQKGAWSLILSICPGCLIPKLGNYDSFVIRRKWCCKVLPNSIPDQYFSSKTPGIRS